MSAPMLITLPPPTPNGGLHMGHLSGPFLAADVFCKQGQLLGERRSPITYSDANQSYVRVTAERLGRAPEELARHHTRDIQDTLALYGMECDEFRYPEAESGRFVRDFFLTMLQGGALVRKPAPFFYSSARACFLDEAGVSGFCPRCLAACKCGICEACAFLNTAETLVSPVDTVTGDRTLGIRRVKVMVLETDRWRDAVRAFYAGPGRFRPRYRWLVEDALAAALPDFPVTVPGAWGVAVDHPDFPGQVINPWAEVLAQLLFSYRQAETRLGMGRPAVVNFFGFDNSYFYAVVHAAMYVAAGEAEWLPAATVINEFYNLQHRKFSTSGNHVIWARDLAARHSTDAIRFYGALNSPGFEKSNFTEAEMREVIGRSLQAPWRNLASSFNAMLGPAPGEPTAETRALGAAALARIGVSYSLDRFHLRQAAEDILHLLGFIESRLAHGIPLADAAHLLAILAQAAYPVMPFASRRLFTAVTGAQLDRLDLTPVLAPSPLPGDPFGLAAGFDHRIAV